MFPLKPSNLKIPGNKTAKREAHTSPTKFGMGDSYGSGVRNPIGKMRSDSVGFRPVIGSKMKKPPKSLA